MSGIARLARAMASVKETGMWITILLGYALLMSLILRAAGEDRPTLGDMVSGIEPGDLEDDDLEDDEGEAGEAAPTPSPDAETQGQDPEGPAEGDETDPQDVDDDDGTDTTEDDADQDTAGDGEPDPERTPQMVPLTALQEERRRRQEAVRRLREAGMDSEEEAEPPAPADPLDELPDDDLVTGAQVKQALRQAREAGRAAEAQARMAESERRTREELSAGKVGKGLDYETVITHPMARQIVQGAAGIIMNAENPARQAYEVCVNLIPDLRKLAQEQHVASELKRLRKPKPAARPAGRPPKQAPPAEDLDDDGEPATIDDILDDTPGGRLTKFLTE